MKAMHSVIFRIHNLASCLNSCRCISTNSSRHNVVRESRFLSKMMKNSGKKRKFYNNINSPSHQTFESNEKLVPIHKNPRTDVLNKLFMKHITELMGTGEVGSQLIGRHIDISHVRVTNDFKHLNVFWFCRNDRNYSESTESILSKCAGHLQHELSQLRLIGTVPPIKFVKNKYLDIVYEVEKRLSMIDYGEDFVPSNNNILKTNERVLFTKLSSETKSEIANFHSTNKNEEEDFYNVDIPVMSDNIFDVDHSLIMNKVKVSLNNLLKPVSNEIPSFSINKNLKNTFVTERPLSNSDRRKLFIEFLKKKKIEREKKRNEPRVEYDVYQPEFNEHNTEEEDPSKLEADWVDEYTEEYYQI